MDRSGLGAGPRRHTLALEGHEQHRRALLEGLAQWGRTLDLRWAEYLAGKLDDA